ncbi:unnamed protein product, partial [Cuscuta epithymum]
MGHASDSEAWKHIDNIYPDFASDPRNVRLGLCSDGFAAHGQYGASYSCWPVILTTYNLPPGMCMKSPYMFLSLIIPGPMCPKKKIDVYLQPLIDELKHLWDEGSITYDVAKNEMFSMRAILMWTISDFPAYGMLSGWSTAGVLGCPICMENSKAFHLKYGGKACYFDCHRQFLPRNHSYRRDVSSFTKGRKETNRPPVRLSGEQIYDRVAAIDTAVDDPNELPEGYGSDHKWTKKSIFWDLPYWKILLVRHNLDVMHIEKNVFDNLFYTLLNDKERTKDNLKARKDVGIYCDRPSIGVTSDFVDKINKAIYTVTTAQKKVIMDWIASIRFPDGYTSNFRRCISADSLRVVHMKSHDCHVFMQRLITIAFREMVPKNVWQLIAELSQVFQTLCTRVVDVELLRQLEKSVILLLCNMEKIFPPGFFTASVHLIVHLPYEARVCGSVQYRWMYMFERFLGRLKKKITNKAHIEASICSAYIDEELSTFASYYFESSIRSKRIRPSRNDVGASSSTTSMSFSIFNHP